jgi:hypothetical protein
MSIRFACNKCGQRLSVGSHKAGKTASCPKCGATIVVPTPPPEPPTPESETPEIIPEPPPLENPDVVISGDPEPSFDFTRNHIEVVYERKSAGAPRAGRRRIDDEPVDLDRVALPRYVIFTQGIMLAVVGIMCFLLGMAVGGAVTEKAGTAPGGGVPIAVSGTVAIGSGGSRAPDAGALVIFLPANEKPDEKGTLEGIRPGDDPAKGVKFRDYLRVLGGGLAYCDQKGQFSVQLPDRGRYYLLAISSNPSGSPNKAASPQEVAQMVRFFDISGDPLEGYRYQWRLENLRGSQRVNVNFD